MEYVLDVNEVVVGLDLSLCNTGICEIGYKDHEVTSIKSKKLGDTPTEEIERIVTLERDIYSWMDEVTPYGTPDLIAIEGLSFGLQKTTSLLQLAALNYLIRKKLYKKNVQFVIIAPTTLKKFVTGSGKGDKNMMMLESYKKWGCSFANDDENDAFCLAKVAEAIIDSLKKKPKLQLLKYQEEVLKTLKPQYVK